VAVADYLLAKRPGNTVSNLSSSRALRVVTERYGGSYLATPVGEVNVVAGMKKIQALIGGEGNGGVIFPELHYGRDALAGIALILSCLAESGERLSGIKSKLPAYEMAKQKTGLPAGTDIKRLLDQMRVKYKGFQADTSDGLKVEFPEGWVHLRRSNTEPIIRIYSEATTREEADRLAGTFAADLLDFVNNC
jgi:phosphomannomutase